jgi:hypothetical protein
VNAHRNFSQEELVDAHRHCSLNESELKQSELCGCFYCLAEFPPSAILEWVDDQDVGEGRTEATALCPKCGIDSVIGSGSGFPITHSFLEAMNGRWFQNVVPSA